MRILIYGAGAVGLGLSSFLLKAKEDLVLVAKPQTAEALQQFGLIRRGIFGDSDIPPSQFQTLSSLAACPARVFDFILVATKSFDSKLAAQDIHAHPEIWNAATGFVLCQNGWGNAEIFENFFPKEQIFNARIITGFERPEPNAVTVTVHADAIHLGNIFKASPNRLKPLAAALTQGGLPAEVTSDIAQDLWAKMLYNCALNPLGAIFDIPYGELGKNEFSRKLMAQIMREIFTVMAACGYATAWDSVEKYEKVFYEKFLPPTAAHRSSTLQDLQKGKPTEIEALNGIIVRLADQYHVPATANRAVYQMVKFLESHPPCNIRE